MVEIRIMRSALKHGITRSQILTVLADEWDEVFHASRVSTAYKKLYEGV